MLVFACRRRPLPRESLTPRRAASVLLAAFLGASVVVVGPAASSSARDAGGLTMIETTDPPAVDVVAQTITYTFAVTNSTAGTVHELSVTDTLGSPAAPALTPTCTLTTLAAGAATSCSATYTVTQADLDHGSIEDTATAIAFDASAAPVISAAAGIHVPVSAAPSLTVAATAAPTTVSTVGALITYSFLVTNTGNETLHNVGVHSRLTASGGQPSTASCSATTLAPAHSTTCTAAYSTTRADFDNGTVDAAATAFGEPPVGHAVLSAPSATSVAARQLPRLSLVTAAAVTDRNLNGFPDVGDTIRWTFVVTNTGNVTLDRLAVRDTIAGRVTCVVTRLAAGGSTPCFAALPRVISQADLDAGHVDNTATASARQPATGDSVISGPSSTSTVLGSRPGLSLAVRGSVRAGVVGRPVQSGDTVRWTFTLTNTGTVTITGLTVTDPTGGPVSCAVRTLVSAASTTCIGDKLQVLTLADLDVGRVRTVATARGTPPGAQAVTSRTSVGLVTLASSPGFVVSPGSAVSDLNRDGVTDVGDAVGWRVTVTNTGNVTLHGLLVRDARSSSVDCPHTTLAPRASVRCRTANQRITATEAVAGVLDNTVTGSARTPSGVRVASAPNAASVTVRHAGVTGFGVTGFGATGAGATGAGGLAGTGAGDLDLLLWAAAWSVLIGALLTITGLTRRRRPLPG